MDKNVVYCGTRNLYPVMVTAAKSLLTHSQIDRVYFVIEDDEFPMPLPECISTVNVANQQWFPTTGANYVSSWTYMAYVRLALGKILPDVHKILYLDTDTIVMKDLSAVFDTDITGKHFGMIREDIGDIPLEMCKGMSIVNHVMLPFQTDGPRPEYCIRPYYNSGVMLMNLDHLRETGMDDALIHELNTVSYKYPDQDAINLLCKGNITEIPAEYNVIMSLQPDFPQDKIVIRHFAAEKPLWRSSLWQKYRRMTWTEVLEKQKALKGEFTDET